MLDKFGNRAGSAEPNHDLDFGVPQFRHLREQCTYPWLLANVLDPALGEGVPLANCPKTAMLEASNGIKLGIIGLAEREWLDTINSLPPNLIYKSASETAMDLVPGLRAEGANIVIALTHAREPNDVKLASKIPSGLIDLILGGHDHFYSHSVINGTHVLRSGTDFKQLSYIEAYRATANPDDQQKPLWDFRITRRDIVRGLPEDPATLGLVEKLTSSLKNKLEKPIGYTAIPLDARFTTVRTRESNLGNFVCDLMRYYYNTECALMAGGTLRGDQVYPPGVIRLKDIMNCFPFEDPVIVVRVKGKAILDALENSISLVPALEGRYPQVSNIQFRYSKTRKPGIRLAWVKINNEELDLGRKYVLATRGYMGRGKDGFTSLLVQSEGGEAEEIVSEENGILISMIMRQYFMSLKVLGKWVRWGPSMGRHWGGVHEKLHAGGKVQEPSKQAHKHTRSGNEKVQVVDSTSTEVDGHLVDSDSDDEKQDGRYCSPSKRDMAEKEQRRLSIGRAAMKKWMRLARIQREGVGLIEQEQGDGLVPHWTKGIAPKLEGRIIVDE
ncbi:MAG: hypothetical protein LQ342_006946 [Letrouitia transgressa]|nr:MAG: hypothetical protein LQ342_006946 [Letrouitia transgressa]